MNEKNSSAGKRSARERLQMERERERAREKRRRLVLVSAAVVGVLGLAAVIGVIAANTGGDGDDTAGPVVAPSGATGDDQLIIPVGASDAPSTITVWEDFRCPACAAFEINFKDTLHELEDSGQAKVDYRLATIIDGNLGGSGSLNAANASACAQDAGLFLPYHDVLYANQPEELDDAFADDARLFELAGQVEGLDTPGFRSCVADGTHKSWVDKSNEAFRSGGFRGTPTVLLNGESVFPQKGNEQISPENLKKWVTEANQGKQPGTVTAPPTGGPTATATAGPTAATPAG